MWELYQSVTVNLCEVNLCRHRSSSACLKWENELSVDWWRPDIPPDPGDPLSQYRICSTLPWQPRRRGHEDVAVRWEDGAGERRPGSGRWSSVMTADADVSSHSWGVIQLSGLLLVSLFPFIQSVPSLTRLRSHKHDLMLVCTFFNKWTVPFFFY